MNKKTLKIIKFYLEYWKIKNHDIFDWIIEFDKRCDKIFAFTQLTNRLIQVGTIVR